MELHVASARRVGFFAKARQGVREIEDEVESRGQRVAGVHPQVEFALPALPRVRAGVVPSLPEQEGLAENWIVLEGVRECQTVPRVWRVVGPVAAELIGSQVKGVVEVVRGRRKRERGRVGGAIVGDGSCGRSVDKRVQREQEDES